MHLWVIDPEVQIICKSDTLQRRFNFSFCYLQAGIRTKSCFPVLYSIFKTLKSIYYEKTFLIHGGNLLP